MAPRTDAGPNPFIGELVSQTFDAAGQEIGIYQSAFDFIEPVSADEVPPKCAANRSGLSATRRNSGTPSPGFRDQAEGLHFGARICTPVFLTSSARP